jgi:hypothetical protein
MWTRFIGNETTHNNGTIVFCVVRQSQCDFDFDNPIFSSERMLYKDCNRKGSVEKISGRESQGFGAKAT